VRFSQKRISSRGVLDIDAVKRGARRRAWDSVFVFRCNARGCRQAALRRSRACRASLLQSYFSVVFISLGSNLAVTRRRPRPGGEVDFLSSRRGRGRLWKAERGGSCRAGSIARRRAAPWSGSGLQHVHGFNWSKRPAGRFCDWLSLVAAVVADAVHKAREYRSADDVVVLNSSGEAFEGVRTVGASQRTRPL